MTSSSTGRLMSKIQDRLSRLKEEAVVGQSIEQRLKLKTSCAFSEQRIEQELAMIMEHFDQLTCEEIQWDREKYWVINFPCCGLQLTLDTHLQANLSNLKSINLDFQLDQPGAREELLGCLLVR